MVEGGAGGEQAAHAAASAAAVEAAQLEGEVAELAGRLRDLRQRQVQAWCVVGSSRGSWSWHIRAAGRSSAHARLLPPHTRPRHCAAQAQLEAGNRGLQQRLQSLQAEAAGRSGMGLQALTLGEEPAEAGLVPTRVQQAGAPWDRQFLP